MKLRTLRSLALIALAHAPLLAHAATLRVPQNFATIQEASTRAVDGDIVRGAAGTYNEKLTIQGKAISVIGAGPKPRSSTTKPDGSSR